MALLAGFQAHLWRYTRQNDVVVGSPMAERQQIETEKLIGLFANLVILRTQINDSDSFLHLLQKVKHTVTQAQVYQHVPFEKVVEEVDERHTLSHMPLAQVVFAWQSGLIGTLRLGDLTGKLEQIDTGTAKFDLTLIMEEDEDDIRGWIEYRPGLFTTQTIQQFAE